MSGPDDAVIGPPVGTLFTVNGSGESDPTGSGLPADVARAVADGAHGMWNWQPVGYPAAIFPMRPSIHAGRERLRTQIDRNAGNVVLCGHGQGALVVDIVWRDDVLHPAGVLHHRFDDVVAIITFGDPMRCPGIANGNAFAGQPMPQSRNGFTTGGIAGTDALTRGQTPNFLMSFALDGDPYACAPTGEDPWRRETESGHDERIIFDIVQNATAATPGALAVQAADVLGKPLFEVAPLVQAVVDGALFAPQGLPTPHCAYDIRPAIRYLIERGRELRSDDPMLT